ncbi:MAG: dUTP diphosphatase [Candidatus Nanoarchaeia archaeon]
MRMKVKKIHPDAKLPSYAHEGDAGMDVFALEDCTLKAGERKTLRTGISYELEPGFVSLIWDKSGLASKHGLKTMAGVIESNYRGELMIVLLNTSDVDYHIEKGDKIANMLIQPVTAAKIEEVQELSDANRGTNAFGSSGRK